MLLRQFSLFLPLALALPAVQAGSDNTVQVQSCADVSKPSTFSLKGVTYLRYEVSPYQMDAMPNLTQLAFEVVNNANGVSIGCSAQNVENEGRWPDTSNYWYKCQDRSLKVGANEYPITTSARIVWDDWKLSVNQTVDCGGYVRFLPTPVTVVALEALVIDG